MGKKSYIMKEKIIKLATSLCIVAIITLMILISLALIINAVGNVLVLNAAITLILVAVCSFALSLWVEP